MKTLIIHPNDPSTDFLEIVYNDIPNKTVIVGGKTKKELYKLMESHDRIMMMGHGTPNGLLSVGQFKNMDNGFIIDEKFVDILNQKNYNVYIWCNADKFVERYKLKGLYSGMFISEVGEAMYCGLKSITQDVVDESNFAFCGILSEHINEKVDSIYDNLMKRYGSVAAKNNVALYNYNRLYLST